jgi:Chlorophyll A-B binding protein
MSANTNIISSMNNNRNSWIWGFTPQAELWNGRLAMIGFMFAVLIEVFSGQGLLHFWDIL